MDPDTLNEDEADEGDVMTRSIIEAGDLLSIMSPE